jgi:hypothetical protein
MTFMSWTGPGNARGRCDARCHDAERGPCDCLCNGVYHGAGRKPGELLRRVQVHGEEVLAQAKARAAAEGLTLVAPTVAELLAEIPGQRTLFGGGTRT